MKISSIPFSRLTVILAFSLIFGSVTFAVSAINTPETGYLLCVDKKTNVVTFPGDSKCPKGSSRLQLGAKGLTGATGEIGPKGDKGDTGLPGTNGTQGAIGANGLTGPAGANGVNGSSILTGVGAPNNQLGNNGDTYIDKNSAQIYGPKTSGLWGYPTSFGGPAGAPGPKGDTGAAGLPGTAIALDLPTNFHQKFKINTTPFSCCWPGNENIKIAVSFKNVTNSNWEIVGGADVDSIGQLWLHFFDANGEIIYGSNQSTAFSPGGQSMTTTWDGISLWGIDTEKDWIITLSNMYANKPANAVYVSIVFRLLNVSPLAFFLDGDQILTKTFAASAFNPSN